MKLDLLTIVSLIIIVLSFLAGCFYVYRCQKKSLLINKRRWIEQIPSLISTLGVLGTFLGITVGLMAFDSNHLDTSIPNLLDGLKTAFFTSLAGMIGSVILSRQVSKVYDDSDEGVSDINIAAKEIVHAVENSKTQIKSIEGILLRQNENQNTYYNIVTSILQALPKINSDTSSLLLHIQDQNIAIGAQENTIKDIYSDATRGVHEIIDYTTTQLNAAKQTMADVRNEMANRFNEFSDLLKRSNTEALVEVMTSVTKEFQGQMNALINKLVQENFDQLNKSVEQLNVWQQENKVMVSSLVSQYKQMCDDMERTSDALEHVGVNTRLLVAEDGKLKKIVDALNAVMIDDKHFVEIASNLTSAADLAKSNIEHFEESTRALNDWVRKQRNFVDSVVLLIEKLEDLNKIRDYGAQFWKDTKHSLEEGVGYIAQGAKSLNQQLTELDKQFYARLSTTLAELDSCIQAMIKSKK